MKILKLDDIYFEEVKKYNKKDAYIAIMFYVFVFILHIIMGIVYYSSDSSLIFIVNILLATIVIVITKLRKQKLSSIGFTKKKFMQSLTLGFLSGTIVAILNNIKHLSTPGNLISFGMLLSLGFYYFIIIGLVEEIIFRGYIQTRMYALIKNEVLCVTVVALLFMIMHIPFQIITSGLSLDNGITILMTFVWHFAFNHLYMKYNSIVAPTFFHGFMNLSNKLFY